MGSMFTLAIACSASGQPPPASSKAADLNLDHAILCESGLRAIDKGFADVGLKLDYGGRHLGAVTHEAVLGFEDGSYIGLMAPVNPPAPKGVDWSELMNGNAGPCEWAVAFQISAAH